MTHSNKVKYLLESIRKHTKAFTTLDFKGNKKIVTIAIPKPPVQESTAETPQGQEVNIMEEESKENDISGEDEDHSEPLLGQRLFDDETPDQGENEEGEDLEGIIKASQSSQPLWK